MNFREAFDLFNREREEKFIQRNEAHKDEMQIGSGVEDILELEIEDLWCHYWQEVGEFEDNADESSESFDVSNMAFLIWWHMEESKELVNSKLG